MTSRRRGFRVFLLGLALALAFAPPRPREAAAQEQDARRVDLPNVAGMRISATPELATRLAFDDNLYFQDIEGYEALIAPSMEVLAENERTSVALNGRMDIYSHPDHGELERMNRRLDLDASHSFTRRLAGLASAGIVFDKSFEETLDQGGTVTRQRPRRKGRFSPGLRWMLGERDRLELRLPFEGARHDGKEESNFSAFGAQAVWRHELGDRRTATLLELADERRVYETGEERIRTLLPGLEHVFSPRTRATLYAGAAFTDADYSQGGGSRRDGASVLRADIAHKGERWNVLFMARREGITSANGESLRRNRLTAQGSYALSERLDARLSMTAQHSRTAGRIGELETVLFRFSPALAYELDEDTVLTFELERTSLHDRVEDTRKTRNRAHLGLTWTWPEID